MEPEPSILVAFRKAIRRANRQLDLVEQSRIGQELENLLERYDLLSISRFEDDEENERFQVSPVQSGSRAGRGATLLEALIHVDDTGPRKPCLKCKQSHPVNFFSADKTTKDGRASRCRACERERAREGMRKLREKKRDTTKLELRSCPKCLTAKSDEEFRYRKQKLSVCRACHLEQNPHTLPPGVENAN
jgi:hypothetical protein